MSRDCCVALPHNATGLSAVCGIFAIVVFPDYTHYFNAVPWLSIEHTAKTHSFLSSKSANFVSRMYGDVSVMSQELGLSFSRVTACSYCIHFKPITIVSITGASRN